MADKTTPKASDKPSAGTPKTKFVRPGTELGYTPPAKKGGTGSKSK